MAIAPRRATSRSRRYVRGFQKQRHVRTSRTPSPWRGRRRSTTTAHASRELAGLEGVLVLP